MECGNTLLGIDLGVFTVYTRFFQRNYSKTTSYVKMSANKNTPNGKWRLSYAAVEVNGYRLHVEFRLGFAKWLHSYQSSEPCEDSQY